MNSYDVLADLLLADDDDELEGPKSSRATGAPAHSNPTDPADVAATKEAA